MDSPISSTAKTPLSLGLVAGRQDDPSSSSGQNAEPFVDENRAAEHLGVSPRTMQRWRSTGTGPPWFRIGRLAKYRITGLTAWAEAQARTSTSDKIADACRRGSTSDMGR
jgi:hypothetical protein